MSYISINNVDLNRIKELIKAAERYLGYDSLYIWNVNINGIIVQLRTNDITLDTLWKENWHPAAYDDSLRPHGTIYAITQAPKIETGIYYHSETRTGIVFNPESYEAVRELGIRIVMDISLHQKHPSLLRGALVDINGEGVMLTGKVGSGKSTHAFLLLDMERSRIHSNDLFTVKQLGGEKGRLSTHTCERKFYLKNELSKINPRLRELSRKCHREDDHFMLDPWWIGGSEKYVDTTRIKLIFILQKRENEQSIAKRLTKQEALNLLMESALGLNPFSEKNEEKMALLESFLKDILQFVTCYEINTSKPIFQVQKRLHEIILFKEYLEPETSPRTQEVTITPVGLDDILRKVKDTVDSLRGRSNVTLLDENQVRSMAEEHGTRTVFGNYNFTSTVKNRSANLTVYIGSSEVQQRNLNQRQREILRNLPLTIDEVHKYLERAPLVSIERTMGDNSLFTPRCTLYVSIQRREMVRLAYMVSQTLFPPRGGEPHLQLVYIPEWQEKDRQILVFPEIGVTYVLGTDYYGEAKKGFLRMAMWMAKKRGMLGLHAGAKIVRARSRNGRINRYGMLIFGLTATGKTTHTCHNHGLTGEGEGIEIIQDDVIFLRPDCSALGTEKGFYLKTEGVTPEIQPLIYNAVTKPDAIFENVMVDYLGNVYFGDETLTGNARGIMQRDDFGEYRSPTVNLPSIEELDGLIIIFITRRNTVVPIAQRLTAEQAAATFMLGESIETSGSDPRRAGESIREVGMNPFIIGDESEEGNRFYDFVKKHEDKIQFYQLNTGGVGEIMVKADDGTRVVRQKVVRVEIPEMAAIIRAIARGDVEWTSDPNFGTQVPARVPGVDMEKFNLNKYYTPEQITYYVQELKRERKEYLAKFPKLYPEILSAID
ncbi:MAG: phosphoenolpyruvate carboxykinase [Candidatus Bathyarchaeia archaeon]|nr:phosphoenolpyruvate carboxykinase [Candidatus Bathyarchaeota archaeon]